MYFDCGQDFPGLFIPGARGLASVNCGGLFVEKVLNRILGPFVCCRGVVVFHCLPLDRFDKNGSVYSAIWFTVDITHDSRGDFCCR